MHKDFLKKMTSFSFFKYFDAFELDVNIVKFVYYGKTRMDQCPYFHTKKTQDKHLRDFIYCKTKVTDVTIVLNNINYYFK